MKNDIKFDWVNYACGSVHTMLATHDYMGRGDGDTNEDHDKDYVDKVFQLYRAKLDRIGEWKG